MNRFKGKKILIFQQRDWAKHVGHFLAKKMRDEGCELSAVTLKRRTHKFITLQKEVKYHYVVNIDDIVENPEKYLVNENVTLDEICREFNIDSVWPMLHANRYLTRSYRRKFYYGYGKNVSDEFMVSYIKAYYVALRDLFAKFKPDMVIIVAFVSDEHMMLKHFADKYKIPILATADTKVPEFYTFAYDEMVKKGDFRDRFFELQNGAKSDNIGKAKQFIAEFKEKFKAPVYPDDKTKKISWIKKIRHELSPYKQIFDWYTKELPSMNYIKSVGPTIDYKPPKIILRDFYCQKKYEKFAKNYKYYPLEKAGKFVFYPLKYTPEGNMDLMCPLYNNQIELARQIAMSLPGDYTLVIKEHWGMVGLRTPSYLEKVDRTPNVQLVDYRIPSEELIKKSDMVISTFSTCFFEAAFYNKPAIMFSDSGIFEMLPNVFRHTDPATLSGKIKEVLSADLKTEAYERQLENFITAVYDVGFNFDYSAAWLGEKKDLEELWQIYKKELEKWFAIN